MYWIITVGKNFVKLRKGAVMEYFKINVGLYSATLL